MSIVVMSEKGQVTIPQDIRKRLHIVKGDALLVEVDPQGAILLRLAMVLPVEMYSEQRLKEFAHEDTLTEAEQRRLKQKLHGKS
jgi:AbrB family looped-hinge helix DNA binding protein